MSRLVRVAGFGLLLAWHVSPLRAGEIPFLSGRVNDLAEILSQETSRDIERMLRSHEDSTSNQVVVLTIPNLEGEEIESYSLRVAESWHLGQKGKDNGVLLLIARDDRKVRIEVGRGLEGNLPDITCGQIIRHEIVPRFKEGDYNGGTTAGVQAILAALAGSYVADSAEGDTPPLAVAILGSGIFLLVVGTFTLFVLFQKGFFSWFLYVFLLPFWFSFPYAFLGRGAGLVLFVLYAVLTPAAKLWFRFSPSGAATWKRWKSNTALSFVASGGGGRSGSSGGGFSGGGGGFSGGGASGSW